MKDSLGDRMKNNYEARSRINLYRRMPVIIRLDGKAFHTVTRGCEKPFDKKFSFAMDKAMISVMEQAQGAKLGYVQSDEISILLTDYDTHETQAWFNNQVQKICSVSASIASVEFTEAFGRKGYFDCRCFNIPREEVTNYFIWRQQDWMRNSVQMLARSHFSQKQLHNKNVPAMHEMLHEKGVNWATDISDRFKNGGTYVGEEIRNDVIFKDRREMVEKLVYPEEKNE
jgi:tRNA(His) 5'-end guanylyltransferase